MTRSQWQSGRHTDVPAQKYHAAAGLGSTAIRTSAQTSVAHYLSAQRAEPTAAMRRGQCHHSAILEPTVMGSQYVVAPVERCIALTGKKEQCKKPSVPGADKCTTHNGKAQAAAWLESLPPGTEVISQTEYDDAVMCSLGVRDSIARLDGNLSTILDDGDREVSYFAQATLSDDWPGYKIHTLDQACESPILVKARIDIDYSSIGLLVDLKGIGQTEHMQPRRFAWRCRDMGLVIQAALYVDIVEAVVEKDQDWTWLCHESSDPYAVRLFEIDEDDINTGRTQVGIGLQRWAAYQKDGNRWEGWPTNSTPVALPQPRTEDE
jgi:hypothetical protein